MGHKDPRGNTITPKTMGFKKGAQGSQAGVSDQIEARSNEVKRDQMRSNEIKGDQTRSNEMNQSKSHNLCALVMNKFGRFDLT